MSAAAAAPLVEVAGLKRSFGGLQALDGASFGVEAGTVTALIGPNGAGKTTAVNVIAGALRPEDGHVTLGGRRITGWPSNRIASAGLIRTFQLSRELGGLTVLENLLVTPRGQAGESLLNVFFRPRRVAAEERANLVRALEILAVYGLYDLRDTYARELSGGQKRLLELARAVMAEPTVLLLDEPMAGINPALVELISRHIVGLRERGITVLMVEHNLNVVESICEHVIVMAEGRTLATGRLAELRANPEVVRAYLGGALSEGARG